MIKSLSHLKHGEFYFPMTDGTNGQVLVTDGSGQLTWATQSTGSNKFLSGLSFDTGTGVLTATVTGSADVTIDLDGRYIQGVRGDGTTISTSTDLDTGQVVVSPIFNNTITETGTALVTSGTIWTYINDSILDIAPVQSVAGDGVSISTSTDTDTGQVNIGPIVNNVPTQNSGALVKSGGIWSYIDGLAFDEYTSWNLKTNSVQRTSIQSGGTLDLIGGTNVSLSYGAGGKVTIDSTDTNTDTNHYLSGASFNTGNGKLTLTVTGNTNQVVDLDGRYEYAGHKYHSFSDGQQFYDSYNQANYLRLFTENTVFDTFRFRSYSDVEFWNGTAWEAWTQSLDVLFDGREETGFSLQHANKRFRFVINRSSGWPTTALFVLQSTWSDTKDHTCDVKIETYDGTNWNEKTRWTYSNFQRGMNVHTTSSLHDGKNKMRVEIDIDWTDLSHDYFPFKSLFLLSNYSGGQTLDPWTWDYSGSVNFQALPKSAGDNLATQTWVGSQGYASGSHNHDADYVNVTGDTMTGDLSIKGNILLTGDATTANQDRMIDFTGFDKEGTTDFSDRAYIRHTEATGGHAGSVLEISSQNDVGDGISFTTHASSLLRHNGNAIFSTGHKPTWSEIEDKPTTFDPSSHNHDGRYLKLNPRLNANGDTVKESGIHIWDVSGASDDPVGASDGLLTTKYWDSSDWAVQMFEDFHQREIHIRNKRSGTWQEDWAQVHTTDNFSVSEVDKGVTAYGWGDHAEGGYLTSYSETSDLESVRARDNSISGAINFLPDTGAILQVDGQTIIDRQTLNGAITIGHDDSIILAGGDTSSTLNTNINNAEETVFIGAEGGLKVFAFPDNMSGGWSARKEWRFQNDGHTDFPGNLYPSGGSTHYVDSTRIANWQTAYGWGDHSTAGYTKTDTIFNGGDVDNPVIIANRSADSILHYAQSGNWKGAVKITIPGSHTSNWSMLVLRITIYEYTSDAHTTYTVSGHDWTSGWYNKSIKKWGHSKKNVDFGYSTDANQDYLIVGEIDSSWSYGHVTVDVIAHPSFYSSSMNLDSGWKIEKTTDLEGITRSNATNIVVHDSANLINNSTEWNSAYTHSQSTHAPTDAEKNVQSDWSATSGDAFIKNKPSTFAPSSHNHTSLTGVTNLTFAAQSSDAASITTTIDGTHTYFDFNLTDDNNNDWWRWRFTPSGSTLYDAMVLKPASNGNANLIVSGNVTADNIPTSYAPVDAEKNVQADWNATSGDALILNKPSLAFNTIIGTDSDINTSGAIVIDQLNMTDGVIQSHSTRTLTAANLGISKPAKPINLSLSVVNDTINVTFAQAAEDNHEYLVFSAVNDSSFGLISVFSPEDFAKNMSVIDDSFTESGKIHYRVYAVKNGIYSEPLTAAIDYTTPTNDVANIYTVSLNTAHFIQWDQPSINSRFINTYKLYGQTHADKGSLSKANATLLYDGLNTSFMHAVSKDDNFTQFWVDVIYN